MGGGGEKGRTHLLLALRDLNIEHASVSRRSTGGGNKCCKCILLGLPDHEKQVH